MGVEVRSLEASVVNRRSVAWVTHHSWDLARQHLARRQAHLLHECVLEC